MCVCVGEREPTFLTNGRMLFSTERVLSFAIVGLCVDHLHTRIAGRTCTPTHFLTSHEIARNLVDNKLLYLPSGKILTEQTKLVAFHHYPTVETKSSCFWGKLTKANVYFLVARSATMAMRVDLSLLLFPQSPHTRCCVKIYFYSKLVTSE